MGPYLLGIDKGTSVTKAVVFDLEGNEIATAQSPIRTHSPFPGWQEEDPREAWAALKAVIRTVVGQVDAQEIIGIGPTGYMGSAWLVDGSGRETRNGIVWTDQRAAGLVRQWNGDGTADELFAIGGNAVLAGLTLVLVAWLNQHEREIVERSEHVLCSKDWVRFKLTGVAATDESDIMWMPGDPRRRTYADRLFALMGIEDCRRLLPEVLPSDSVGGTLLPEVAAELGLPQGIPVVVGMGDACCGHYAAGALDEGQACTILGTSLINGLTTSTPIFEPAPLGVLFTLIGGKWIRMLPNTGGGSINLRWFIDTLGEPFVRRAQEQGVSVYNLLDAEVQGTPVGSNGVLYHPYINPAGVIAPFYNLSASAGFFGMRIHNTLPDMLRAGLRRGRAVRLRLLCGDTQPGRVRPADRWRCARAQSGVRSSPTAWRKSVKCRTAKRRLPKAQPCLPASSPESIGTIGMRRRARCASNIPIGQTLDKPPNIDRSTRFTDKYAKT